MKKEGNCGNEMEMGGIRDQPIQPRMDSDEHESRAVSSNSRPLVFISG
jgi:hypothetical protein